jgi:hypothetical protein
VHTILLVCAVEAASALIHLGAPVNRQALIAAQLHYTRWIAPDSWQVIVDGYIPDAVLVEALQPSLATLIIMYACNKLLQRLTSVTSAVHCTLGDDCLHYGLGQLLLDSNAFVHDSSYAPVVVEPFCKLLLDLVETRLIACGARRQKLAAIVQKFGASRFHNSCMLSSICYSARTLRPSVVGNSCDRDIVVDASAA